MSFRTVDDLASGTPHFYKTLHAGLDPAFAGFEGLLERLTALLSGRVRAGRITIFEARRSVLRVPRRGRGTLLRVTTPEGPARSVLADHSTSDPALRLLQPSRGRSDCLSLGETFL